MTEPDPASEIADEVPWSAHVTEYDDRLDAIYIRLFDADAEGASKEDIARRILGIDPAGEPQRPRKAVESHLPRARWITKVSCRELVTRDRPDQSDGLLVTLFPDSLPYGTPKD